MEKSKFIKEIAAIIVQQVVSRYEGMDGRMYDYITLDLKSRKKIYKSLYNYSGVNYTLAQAIKENSDEFALFGITVDKYDDVNYNGITVNDIK